MATELFDKAKRAKADEFYTQLPDIEREMRHYKEQFRGKTVFCNCDDPYESNFFKYFAMNFNFFGLKKLIATCYTGSSIANTQLSLFDDEPIEDKTTKSPHKIIITEVDDYNGDGAIDLADVEYLLTYKEIFKLFKDNQIATGYTNFNVGMFFCRTRLLGELYNDC
jgi:hypothetical protein